MYVVVTVEAACILYVHPFPHFFLVTPSPSPSLTACDLVSLGSVDVPGPGSDALLAQTVQQMKNLELSTANIVTFKASMKGITLTDNVNG